MQINHLKKEINEMNTLKLAMLISILLGSAQAMAHKKDYKGKGPCKAYWAACKDNADHKKCMSDEATMAKDQACLDHLAKEKAKSHH